MVFRCTFRGCHTPRRIKHRSWYFIYIFVRNPTSIYFPNNYFDYIIYHQLQIFGHESTRVPKVITCEINPLIEWWTFQLWQFDVCAVGGKGEGRWRKSGSERDTRRNDSRLAKDLRSDWKAVILLQSGLLILSI